MNEHTDVQNNTLDGKKKREKKRKKKRRERERRISLWQVKELCLTGSGDSSVVRVNPTLVKAFLLPAGHISSLSFFFFLPFFSFFLFFYIATMLFQW